MTLREQRSVEPTPRSIMGFPVRSLWLVTVVCAALSVVVGAVSALNTALVEIAPDLGASSNDLTWLVDGYAVALAALLLPAGALGDRWGRRGVMVAGLVVFALSSLPPIWTHDVVVVIVSRCSAGVGAALIMPATLSLITSELPDSKRTVGVAMWSAVAGVGSLMSLFVTGLLLEFFSWRSVFVVFASASAGIAVASATIATSRSAVRKPFDTPGSFMSAVGMASVVFALLEAPGRGWGDPWVLVCLCAGLLLLAAFVIWQLRAAAPLLDVRLFRNRAFSAGSLSVLLQFLVALGLYFVTLQRMQLVFGFSPLMSALATLPVVAVIAVVTPAGMWLAVRFDLRFCLTVGTICTAVGMFAMAYVHYDNYSQLLPMFMIAAVGLGLAAAPATSAIMVNTPEGDHGVGSAVNDTSRELGAALGTAVAGSVVAAGYSSQIRDTASAAAAQSPELAERISRSLAEAIQIADRIAQVNPAAAQTLRTAAQNAYITPMNTACAVMGVIVSVGAVVFAIGTPRRMDQAGHAERAETVDQAPGSHAPALPSDEKSAKR